MSPADFAARLLARGIEIHIRRNTGNPWLWPHSCLRELPEPDLAFFAAHRSDLQRMVQEGSAPRLPANHPGFPTPHGVATPPSGVAAAEAEPDPIVWTADYSRRITESDVLSVLGSLPTHDKRQSYERTRDELALRDSQRPFTERYRRI
jgi:hypothetical protein